MKTFNYILTLLFVFLLSLNALSQNDFTINKQALNDDMSLIKIQHQNGRYAEFIIEGNEDDFDISIQEFGALNEHEATFQNDVFKKNIKLPSEDYNSTPIQFFDAGEKIYCFGTKEVMVINNATGSIINTINLSNSGSYSASSYLNHVPVNKFICGSSDNEKLFVADLINNLYFIDADADTILLSHSYNNFTDQLSTSVVYNETLDRVYWMLNSWQGNNGTVINVYNGSTGAYITQRFFNNQINDIVFNNNAVIITSGNEIIKLNPQNLNTIKAYTGNPPVTHEKIFCLNNTEIAVVRYHYQNAQRSMIILDISDLTPLQGIYPPFGAFTINDLTVENQYDSFILLVLGDEAYSDVYRYKINQNRVYSVTNHLSEYNVFSRRLSNIVNNSIFWSGRNSLINIDLQQFAINYNDNIKGCYSYDILLKSYNSNDYVYSANPNEGTISRHYSNCSVEDIIQTAFKVNSGCVNTLENKLYFVNSRINYDESGIAIIDADSDNIIKTLKIGKYLTDAVYNENSNKIFVAAKNDSKVFVIGGENDEIIQTIQLPKQPTHLLSYQNKVLCAANTAIYIVDVSNYNYTILNLQFGINNNESCRNFEVANDINRIYALYSYGIYTYVVEIETASFTVVDTHQLNFRKGEVIKYNPTDKRIYIANSLIPKLYIYDPNDFSEINTVSFIGQAVFYDLNMSIDHYRNKAYLTYFNFAQQKHYLTIIDCEEYTYKTTELNTAKSTQIFNPINDQVYYLNTALNQDNKNIMYSEILDCMDDTNLPDVLLENMINRPYTIISTNEQIKPIIDTKRNKAYLPGSDFSNVSVINAFTDILLLQNGWNWISFPRMKRYGNDPYSSISVLENIIYPYPWGLIMHYMDNLNYISYLDNTWDGYLQEVQSTSGYKLDLNLGATSGVTPKLVLLGARLNYDTIITLSAGKENWIGYFIQDAQWPWDAFPASLYNNQLTSITAQYWAMIKIDDKWFASSNVRPIKYGDMVIVTINGNEPVSFAWNNPLEAAEAEAVPETKYYSFSEQAEYLPIFIEKGSEDDFIEVAVLADGVVKGAAVALENDTLVQIRAYLGGVAPGTPLQFETWSGVKSARAGKGNYTVRSHKNGAYEQRTIYSGERHPFHIVSLKPSSQAFIPERVSDINCAPNPFAKSTNFSFRINSETTVKIVVYDIYGKALAMPMNGNFAQGVYNVEWNGNDTYGNRLDNGVYIFKLFSGEGQEVSGKIVLTY